MGSRSIWISTQIAQESQVVVDRWRCGCTVDRGGGWHRFGPDVSNQTDAAQEHFLTCRLGRKSTSSASSSSASTSGTTTATNSTNATTPAAPVVSGGQGSIVTLDTGVNMTYNNAFGGTWYWDPSDPLNNGAQAQSYTPRLNQTWQWGTNKIYGVNVGGWLVTEPFIVPGMYQQYATGDDGTTAIDEYTLSQNMGNNLTAAMTDHYNTFITEQDFMEMAEAGLNWVRIPIGFWAIETYSTEPYLGKVAWTYFVKAIQWARKYGLRINLDFHSLPGSQNGWNHSGHQGTVNWMMSPMGMANAQRSLQYIRSIAQFIAQPQYASVVQMFGFVNEPNSGAISQAVIGSFEQEAYRIIRDITGIGAGNGPFLSVHDSFVPVSNWYNFIPGADRLALDTHPYLVCH